MDRKELLRGHGSRLLAADSKERGAGSFVFEVLDTLPPSDLPEYDPLDDLTVLEDLGLERLSFQPDRLYTIIRSACRPHPSGGRPSYRRVTCRT